MAQQAGGVRSHFFFSLLSFPPAFQVDRVPPKPCCTPGWQRGDGRWGWPWLKSCARGYRGPSTATGCSAPPTPSPSSSSRGSVFWPAGKSPNSACPGQLGSGGCSGGSHSSARVPLGLWGIPEIVFPLFFFLKCRFLSSFCVGQKKRQGIKYLHVA